MNENGRTARADTKAAKTRAKSLRPWYRKKRWWAVGGFVGIIGLSAIFGRTTPGVVKTAAPSPVTTTSTATTATTIGAPTPVATTGRAAPVVAMTTTTTGVASGPAVTGYGATTAAWDANHQAATDPKLTPGAVYDPESTLPQVNGHVGYRYYLVLHESGYVLQYEMALPEGTSIASARAQAAAEFPSDVKVVWYSVMGTCAQEVVSSARLGANLGAFPTALVTFDTNLADGSSDYNPSNIDDMILEPGNYATPADSPGC